MADDEELEYTLLNKREVLVYQVPPASSASGHKADDWKKCIWRGRMRVAGKGTDMSIKMIDASSGTLFAQCSIPGGDHEKYVERVMDSSRYFVLKITNGARHAFIGLGFEDRNDAFDFNCTLADFKSTWVDRDKEVENLAAPVDQGPAKDLSLKEGQKITVNLGCLEEGGRRRRRQPQSEASSDGGGGFGGLLAPPPSAGQSRRQQGTPQTQASPLAAPPAAAPLAAPPVASGGFGDFGAFQAPAAAPALAAAPAPASAAGGFQDDFFGDFDDFQAASPMPAPAPAVQAPPVAALSPTPAASAAFPGGGLASQMDMLSLGGFGGPSSPFPAPSLSQPAMHASPAPAPMGQPMMAKAASPAPAQPFDPFTGIAGIGMLGSGPSLPPAQASQPMMMGFGAPPAAQQQRPKAGSDPFDEFDMFK